MDCKEEGLYLAKSFLEILVKSMNTGDDADVQSMFSLILDLERRCNYWASLQGIVTT